MRGRSSKTSTAPSVSPRIVAVPRLGCRLADASCSSVVFPAPLAPSTTQRSPSETSQSIRSSSVAPSRSTLTWAKCSTSDMRANLPSDDGRPAHAVYPCRVHELSAAGRLAAWGTAALMGAVSPDEAADQVTGSHDPAHRVLGLPGEDTAVNLPYALARLRSLGAGGLRLVLPRPGDVAGLPGPAAFHERALARGEVVLTAGGPALALLGEGRGIWSVSPVAADRRTPLSLTDAARELDAVMREATALLVRLDVARWEPAAAEVLAARSEAARPELPMSADP